MWMSEMTFRQTKLTEVRWKDKFGDFPNLWSKFSNWKFKGSV